MNRARTLLQTFLRLVDAGETAWSDRELVEVAGGYADTLTAAGYLTEATPSRTVQCAQCTGGHLADVIRTGDGQLAYFCTASGSWAEVEARELRRRRIDMGRMLLDLRGTLAPIQFDIREECAGLLWRLGESELGGRAWTAMFARRLAGDDLAAVLSQLPRVSSTPGLVLTGRLPERGVPLVSNHRFIALQAVLHLDGPARWRADVARLATELGVAPPGRGGRKPQDASETLGALRAMTEAEFRLPEKQFWTLLRERVPSLATRNHGKLAPSLVRMIEDEKRRLLSER